LSESRKNAVFGTGNKEAKILFVGEAPGKDEDKQGKPFVGAAGRVLDSMLEKVGIEREDVFITNVIRCHPPSNRDPSDIEKAACRQHLEKTIKILKPAVICTLGRHAMTSLIDTDKTITDLHGKVIHHNGRIFMPLFHPAASLYKSDLKRLLILDFKKLKKLLIREKVYKEGEEA